jgi:hypothetical protein
MLQLAHEYGGDLLDFMKKVRKIGEKIFLVNSSLEEKLWSTLVIQYKRSTFFSSF